ncbi:hypothetical protein ACLKA6_005989 [Drosophila palustris]
MSDTTKINKDADSKAASANADADAATSASSLGASVAVVAEELEPTTNEKGKKEEEPLCLEYATPDAVPLHLRQMLRQHSETKISSVELLMLLIYLVALESGFVEDNAYVKKREELKPVPAVGCFHIYNVRLLSQQSPLSSRKSEDALFRFVLRTLLDASATEDPSTVATLQSHLMAVVLGDLLMVTLSPAPPSKEPGYSICLSIGRYVLNVQLEPLYKRFRKLDELSLQLRQKLFQPMRAQQLLTLKLYLHPSLLVEAPATPGAESCDSYNIFEPTPLDCISIKSSASNYLHDHDINAALEIRFGFFPQEQLFSGSDCGGDSNNGPWEKQKQTPSNQLNNASDNVATKTNEQLQHDLLQQLQQQFQMAAVQQQRQLQHQHSHPPFQQQQQQLQQQQQQLQQQQQQQHNQYATQTHSQRHPKLQHHLSLGGAPIYQQLQQQQQQQQQQQLQSAATSAAPTAYHCQYSTPQHHYRNSNAAAATTTTTAAAAATIRRRTLSHVARSYSVCATMTPATGSVTVAALQQKTSSNQQSANIATSSTSSTSSSTATHVASTKLSVAGHHKTGIMVAASRCRSPIMLCHSHSDGEFPMYRDQFSDYRPLPKPQKLTI